MLSSDQVRHIAKLARLGLKENEVEQLGKQLNSILGYVEKLNEVNTDGVKPTSQVTGLQNIMREDEPRSSVKREELLGCSELPIIFDQIKVKPVISS